MWGVPTGDRHTFKVLNSLKHFLLQLMMVQHLQVPFSFKDAKLKFGRKKVATHMTSVSNLIPCKPTHKNWFHHNEDISISIQHNLRLYVNRCVTHEMNITPSLLNFRGERFELLIIRLHFTPNHFASQKKVFLKMQQK